MSTRQMLARLMEASGSTRFLESLSTIPGILVVNHHRIGDQPRSRFDRGVFSATAQQLYEQVAYAKRRFPVIGAEELKSLIQSAKPIKHLHLVFTFDDGYRDNYTDAFPVFRTLNQPAIFFLVPDYVGTSFIPWWDVIAYQVRNTTAKTIDLPTHTSSPIPVEDERENTIRQVLRLYKQQNTDPSRFMFELEAACNCPLPAVDRRFLDWQEAAEMQQAGMDIGSHTVSHHVLAQLSPDLQQQELRQSRELIRQHVPGQADLLAYPVGQQSSFTPETERLAKEAGYRACFSFYGGINRAGACIPTNLLRTSVDPDPMMFRNQVALLARFGKLPYA